MQVSWWRAATPSDERGSEAGERHPGAGVLGEQAIDRRRVGRAQAVEQIGGDQTGENPLALGTRQGPRLQMPAQARQDVEGALVLRTERRSRSSRTRRASAGLPPPVDTATVRSPRESTAGTMNVHHRGRSTTFSGTPAAAASAANRRAAPRRRSPRTPARRPPGRRGGRGGPRARSPRAPPARANAGDSAGATTHTRAPAASSDSTLRAATAPPPTTTHRRAATWRKMG